MVRQGMCDFGFDPDTTAVIGPQWVRHTRAFGVDLVRIAVTTAADGTMPTGLFRQSLEAYGAEGIEAQAVFTPAFRPTVIAAGWHANMALNTGGDTFNSPYIDGVTLRAAAVARQAVKSGLKTLVWWNEPNLLALLRPGVLVPPGPKGGALAPEVAAALYWQAASRIKHVGVQEVYNGALSILPQGGLDGRNPYYAAYLDAFYQACAKHGKHAPYPWDGWAANCEGAWTVETLTASLAVLRRVMARYGDTGSIRITEWGWQNGHGVNAATAASTYAALQASGVQSATFFQGPGNVPYLGPTNAYGAYGAYAWVQNGTSLIPEGDYAWGPILRDLYHPLPAAA